MTLWQARFDRIALALAVAGVLAIVFGVMFMPHGMSPRAVNSIFAVMAAAGFFWNISLLLFAVGALLVLLAGVIKLVLHAVLRTREDRVES